VDFFYETFVQKRKRDIHVVEGGARPRPLVFHLFFGKFLVRGLPTVFKLCELSKRQKRNPKLEPSRDFRLLSRPDLVFASIPASYNALVHSGIGTNTLVNATGTRSLPYVLRAYLSSLIT
jgi:hypothetical protein